MCEIDVLRRGVIIASIVVCIFALCVLMYLFCKKIYEIDFDFNIPFKTITPDEYSIDKILP